MTDYKPPFTITNKMLDYVSSIMEKIGKLDNYTNFNKMPLLRRNNRIRSIHSSLAIEANSLSLCGSINLKKYQDEPAQLGIVSVSLLAS